MHGRSRDAAYWRHRIERDHPEIAARLTSGEIASVRAAAVAAGLIHEPSGLMQLRRAWRRAGADERAAFMAEIGVAELVPQAARAKRKRAAAESEGDFGDLFAPAMPRPSRAATALNLEAAAVRLAPLRPAAAPPQPAAALERRPEALVASLTAAPAAVSRAEPQAQLAAASSGQPPMSYDDLPETPRAGQEGALQPTAPGAAAAEASAETVAEEGGYPAHDSEETPADGGRKPRLGVRRLFGLAAAKEGEETREPARSEPSETPDGRVKVGQRYVKVDSGGVAWEVVAIFAGPLGVPHVRIANVEERDTLRAVSASALLDRGRYQLLR